MMRPLYSARQIREWEQFSILEQKIQSIQLMERAAHAFCRLFLELYGDRNQFICIIAGPGNNGGDGFAIARLLYHFKYRHIYVFETEDSRLNNQPNDRNKSRKLLQCLHDIHWIYGIDQLMDCLKTRRVSVIDATFGTGLNRMARGEWQSIISIVNQYSDIVISVDIPGGLPSDMETFDLNSEGTILAAQTFCFQPLKRSMTFPETGKYCGRIHVLDIGLSENFCTETLDQIYLLDHTIYQSLESSGTFDHKGSNGKAIQYCGSVKMPGAALLASKSAHRSGAGYVVALLPENNIGMMVVQHPELIPVQYDEKNGVPISTVIKGISGITSILAGPGLGDSEFVSYSIDQILQMKLNIPLILDADALNVLGKNHVKLSDWPGPLIITPHLKEFDRLFGDSFSWLERENKMRKMSASLNICIILKGAYTRIAFPDGTLYINTSGNPGLAKAGSGDVLSGILSGHTARYRDYKLAVLSAVYLHGKAADDLSEGISERSILASDLIGQLGKSIKLLKKNG